MESRSFGLISIELYIPKTFIMQKDFEQSKNLPDGKITKGLGQHQMSFVSELEDVNSMALTVLRNLMRRTKLTAADIGKLEFATETLHDKSKSSKTVLMQLLKANKDIEGVTNINACYGGTAAIFNCLSWLATESKGKLAVVVMSDVAVYDTVAAKPTGGAGAVAVLLGPNPAVVFEPLRASFFDDEYDFFKPHMESEFPVVKGHYSMQLYNSVLLECFESLKAKHLSNGNTTFGLNDFDFFCFHCPFTKQVEKSFLALAQQEISKGRFTPKDTPLLEQYRQQSQTAKAQPATQQLLRSLLSHELNTRLSPSLTLSQSIGNIYNGSLYLSLLSLSLSQDQLANKSVLMYSYGAGVAASLFSLRFTSTFDRDSFANVDGVRRLLAERSAVSVESFENISIRRERVYNAVGVINEPTAELLRNHTFYLKRVKEDGQREYQLFVEENQRLLSIANGVTRKKKFREMLLSERIDVVNQSCNANASVDLQTGGIDFKIANMMVENCIGTIRLPLGIGVGFVVNGKRLLVPMVTEEPSVIAAASNSATLIANHSQGFIASTSRSIVRGHLYLEQVLAPSELFLFISIKKTELLKYLNTEMVPSLVEKGGGVIDLQASIHPNGIYSVDVFVDVQSAMGANTVNTILESLRPKVLSICSCKFVMAIVSNLTPDRIATASFEVPIECLAVGECPGAEVARKIVLANNIAKNDLFRATTHNKGIMNGVDAVAIAVGQDIRAIEASCHAYTIFRDGKYGPLTDYSLVESGKKLRGEIQLPFVVGTAGGMTKMNRLYQLNLKMLGQPDAKELGKIIACVGLAQNLSALKALVTQGIQSGHMKLHAKSIAVSFGIDHDQVQEAVDFMIARKQISYESIREFLKSKSAKGG